MVRDSSPDFLSLAISSQAAEVFFSSNLLGGPHSCRRVAVFLRSLLTGFFGLLLFPKYSLVYWGSKILGGTAPRLRSMSLEELYLPSYLFIQQKIRYLGIHSLLSNGLILVSVFSLHSV